MKKQNKAVKGAGDVSLEVDWYQLVKEEALNAFKQFQFAQWSNKIIKSRCRIKWTNIYLTDG